MSAVSGQDDGGGTAALARRDKWGRRIALLLFVAVAFLAGAFVWASFTGRRQQPAPPVPLPASAADDASGAAPPAETPASASVAPPPRLAPPVAANLTPSEIEALMARGDARLRSGDVTAARALYQACAVAGDGTAALRLGQTFDPAFLGRAGLRGVPGDLGQAAYWYRRGQELGNGEAAFLLRETEIGARSRWNAGAPAHRPRRSPPSE